MKFQSTRTRIKAIVVPTHEELRWVYNDIVDKSRNERWLQEQGLERWRGVQVYHYARKNKAEVQLWDYYEYRKMRQDGVPDLVFMIKVVQMPKGLERRMALLQDELPYYGYVDGKFVQTS